jgi:glycosyltransferase involved in cell wall biosynthesis
LSEVGGLAEIVPDGRCGYVVPPEPVAIAKAIADFFSGDEERFGRDRGAEEALFVGQAHKRFCELVGMTQKRRQ